MLESSNPLIQRENSLLAESNLNKVERLFLDWDNADNEVVDKLIEILDILENRFENSLEDEDSEF